MAVLMIIGICGVLNCLESVSKSINDKFEVDIEVAPDIRSNLANLLKFNPRVLILIGSSETTAVIAAQRIIEDDSLMTTLIYLSDGSEVSMKTREQVIVIDDYSLEKLCEELDFIGVPRKSTR